MRARACPEHDGPARHLRRDGVRRWRGGRAGAPAALPPRGRRRRLTMAVQPRSEATLAGHPRSDSLADVLERVLDKGIVIAGDIQINLLEIELLTIKLRLVVASVDKAREMGIDWWESDGALQNLDGNGERRLQQENQELRERLERLERQVEGARE